MTQSLLDKLRKSRGYMAARRAAQKNKPYEKDEEGAAEGAVILA